MKAHEPVQKKPADNTGAEATHTPQHSGATLQDRRPGAIAQRQLITGIGNSKKTLQQKAAAHGLKKSPTMLAKRKHLESSFGDAAQRKTDDVDGHKESPHEGKQHGTAHDDKHEAHEASPDDRKHAAAQELHAALTAKDGLSRQDLLQLLARIKQQFGLSAAKLEERGEQTQVGLYASPALFVPIAIGGNISGQKPGAKVPTRASVLAGDYIRSTAHDGPFPTPAAEVRTNFNNRFQGQVSGYAGGGGGGGHVAKKAKIPILIPALAAGNIALKTAGVGATYRRAGRVEAKSSVVRGTGRSGNGETIFGHFGNDEEKIKTGATATSYNGGHLVGDQIMDSHRAFDLYADWNLAPQVRGFNSPVYTSTIENPVTSAIRAGATVTYVVNVSYPDNRYSVKPALLAARLWPGANAYKTHVLNAIALTPALNANFLFRRRTPGAWRATASVVAGGQTISSGKISKRPNVAYDNKFRSLRSDRNYNPVGGEQVRYGVATYSAGVAGGKRQVNAGPNPKHYKYKGATTVTVTARQQTF